MRENNKKSDIKSSRNADVQGISAWVQDLCRVLDKPTLMQAYQQARRSERLYAYNDIVMYACRDCFRMYNGNVYAFNGRYWIPMQSADFKNCVRYALVKSAGNGASVLKSDWVDSQKKIMDYAYDGVSMSMLDVSPSLVGFRNGVWDFSDIDNPIHHDFSDRMPVIRLLPYDYNPDAGCPTWLSFLRMMLPANDIMVLQKYLGLGCVNRKAMSHRIEETLWLIGDGANGKTTIQNVVRSVYGQENVSNSRLDDLLARNSDTRLRNLSAINGKIFNLCSEIQADDISRSSDMFKSLCSGEPQDIRRIGKNIETAYDIPFLIFNMNQMPVNRSMDDAFRRRLVQIHFRSMVSAADMDRELGSKLQNELSGIRNWMIDGYKMLVRDGFMFKGASEVCEDNIDYMIANGQTVDVWKYREGLRQSQYAGHSDDRAKLVSSTVLYDRYVSFCVKNLYDAVSKKQFGTDMRRLHFNVHRKRGGVFYEVYSDNELDYAVKI